MKNQSALVDTLKQMLTQASAHVTFNDAVKGLTLEECTKTPANMPYNIWQLVEHIRITQWDILDFCRNKDYKEMNWPDDYWPVHKKPENEAQWKHSVAEVKKDLKEFVELLEAPSADLYKPIPHGSGQHLLREAILIIDHTSYHTGEIIAIRRLINAWH